MTGGRCHRTSSVLDDVFVQYERFCGTSVAIGLLARFHGAPPTLERLRDHLRARLGGTPELRWTFAESESGWRRSRWRESSAVDWAAAVRDLPVAEGTGEAGLRAAVERACEEHLDPAHRPWRCLLVRGFADGEWALLLQVHHALTGAVGLVELLRRALGRAPVRAAPPVPRSPASRLRAWATLLRDGPGFLAHARRTAATAPPVPESGRRITWQSLDTDHLRLLARRHGATVNDVVLALAPEHLAALPLTVRPRRWRALVPVDCRDRAAPVGLGNHLSLMRIVLPCAGDDRGDRIAAVAAATARAKQGPAVRAVRAAVEVLPPRLYRSCFGQVLAPGYADLFISNWGAVEALAYQGEPVRELVPLMWRPRDHRLSTAFLTYGGRTCFSRTVAAYETGPVVPGG
ncbi:wax ester/triacylglycerol synthase domain-containing protein [Glycomyces dulcitolivorans]|uniref:wax ester/triacylglycerol synthase domain-containing protein n=1 Tax=Glycomyces dulcitolivorans TaxID=2200759 RepID=UPI000DD3F2E0|nr:wax ester/triacylglycerol synthase domain-containing protein [Glycomyces dulcitolivorans]